MVQDLQTADMWRETALNRRTYSGIQAEGYTLSRKALNEPSHSKPYRFLRPLVQAEMNPRCARSQTPKSLQSIYLSSYEYCCGFLGKMRVVAVAKSSISEGLPNAEFPLLSKNHLVSLKVCLP